LATTGTAIALAVIPSEVATRPVLFVAKVVGGAIGLMVVGLVFYFLGRSGGRWREVPESES
jgi:hypothetical protein